MHGYNIRLDHTVFYSSRNGSTVYITADVQESSKFAHLLFNWRGHSDHVDRYYRNDDLFKVQKLRSRHGKCNPIE